MISVTDFLKHFYLQHEILLSCSHHLLCRALHHFQAVQVWLKSHEVDPNCCEAGVTQIQHAKIVSFKSCQTPLITFNITISSRFLHQNQIISRVKIILKNIWKLFGWMIFFVSNHQCVAWHIRIWFTPPGIKTVSLIIRLVYSILWISDGTGTNISNYILGRLTLYSHAKKAY